MLFKFYLKVLIYSIVLSIIDLPYLSSKPIKSNKVSKLNFIDNKSHKYNLTKNVNITNIKNIEISNNLSKELSNILRTEIVKFQNQFITQLAITDESNIDNFSLEIESNIQYQIENVYHAEGNVIIYFSNAIINGDVTIGDGSVIFSGAIIANESKIGEHCFIGPNTNLEHNNTFGSFSSCGAGVNCGGRVDVGKYSFLGIGTSVKHQVNIGENCIVGGQSLILKNCHKNSLYFGVPAKKHFRLEVEKYSYMWRDGGQFAKKND